MKNNEFYSNSLDALIQRVENKPQNEKDYIFNWILTQFHFKIGIVDDNSYTLKIRGVHKKSFGLKHHMVSECYPADIISYSDFCNLIKDVLKIFEEHPNLSVSSYIPEKEKNIRDLEIILSITI